MYIVKFIVYACFCNFLYNSYFILSREIIITKVLKCTLGGIENGQAMHALSVLEGYFKENTNKWLRDSLAN